MPLNLSAHFVDAERILVFGGPYSNLQATQAMRATAETLGIPARHVICTGDVVAYCGAPADTVNAVRDWGIHVIAGNCEQQLAAEADDCACGFEAGSACDVLSKGWFGYANARINASDRAWMAGLADTAWFNWAGLRFDVVHGAHDVTSRFVFPSQQEQIAEALRQSDADIVLAGHCGLPFGSEANGQFWLNAGVIGQPANDGTRDGWFAVISRDGNAVTAATHRLTYDAEAAAAQVRAGGYADPYGDALLSGIWPNHDILPDAETAATGITLRAQSFVLQNAPILTETAA